MCKEFGLVEHERVKSPIWGLFLAGSLAIEGKSSAPGRLGGLRPPSSARRLLPGPPAQRPPGMRSGSNPDGASVCSPPPGRPVPFGSPGFAVPSPPRRGAQAFPGLEGGQPNPLPLSGPRGRGVRARVKFTGRLGTARRRGHRLLRAEGPQHLGRGGANRETEEKPF